MPGWSVSEKVFDSPAATFSTSPRIRLPSSTSNSVTAAVPSFLTAKFVAPAGISNVLGSQPLSLSVMLTVRAPFFPPESAASLPQPAAATASAARPASESLDEMVMRYLRRSRQRVSGSGPVGSLLGLAAQAPAIRPDDVEGHRDDVEEPEEDLARGGLGLQAEHAGEQRAPDRARLHQPAEVERLPWRLLNQPASCAVCTEVASSPAATKTSTSPVPRKKRVRLMRTPPR